MIAKKVPNPKKSASKSERAGRLTDYITAPEHENGLEKCIHFAAVNFLTDTLAAQKLEMIALSQEGVKSKDPIDHWVLSWRHDEHPTPEQARIAVAMFVEHCGLSGHQYLWGLHDDTQNRHVHIAVNRVHPDTLRVTKINQGFDREASQQAIALIEHAQGWQRETGARYDIEHGKPLKREQDPAKVLEPSSRARDMELQTGEKSAERLGIENAAPIIKNAHSWKELHARLAAQGMRYERNGSGAQVHVGGVALKASTVDRAASLPALQKRLGPYQPPQEIKKNDYHHHTPQPYPAAFGENAGHGLRNLSECRLAYREKGQQTSRAGVLQLDARADRPGTGGLRRDAGPDRSTGLAPQPMRPGQPGWKEYIAIRDAQKTARSRDTTALQTRHGAQRTALLAQLKAERDAVLAGSWTGNGEFRNTMQSVLAAQQAIAKLALSERQRAERKELQARYKPLPMYKQWKEQALIVGQTVRSLADQHATRDRQPAGLSEFIQSLSRITDQRDHVTYRHNGRDLFRDEGRIIQVLDLQSDAGIAAALAIAQQKFGNPLTLTGSAAFQENAIAIAVANNLTCRFADPALDALRERLTTEKYRTERIRAAEIRAAEIHAAEIHAAAQRTLENEKAARPRNMKFTSAIPPMHQQAQRPAVPVAQPVEPPMAMTASQQAVTAAIEKKIETDGLTPEQRAIVTTHVRENEAKVAAAPARDYRNELIEEVARLTGDQAEIGQETRLKLSGLVFAVNEQFAAMHLGRGKVHIIDRAQSPVELGNWEVSKNRPPERKTLSVIGLQNVFGKAALAQIDKARANGVDFNQGVVKDNSPQL